MNEVHPRAALRMAAATDDETKRWQSLSPRERQSASLMMEGKRTKDIARLMSISPRTVEIHRARIFDKLEVRSPAQVAVIAFKIKVRLELQGGCL